MFRTLTYAHGKHLDID